MKIHERIIPAADIPPRDRDRQLHPDVKEVIRRLEGVPPTHVLEVEWDTAAEANKRRVALGKLGYEVTIRNKVTTFISGKPPQRRNKK